jgi:hypothetical protein
MSIDAGIDPAWLAAMLQVCVETAGRFDMVGDRPMRTGADGLSSQVQQRLLP